MYNCVTVIGFAGEASHMLSNKYKENQELCLGKYCMQKSQRFDLCASPLPSGTSQDTEN